MDGALGASKKPLDHFLAQERVFTKGERFPNESDNHQTDIRFTWTVSVPGLSPAGHKSAIGSCGEPYPRLGSTE